MAQGVGPMYVIQPAFTTGEISYDVANRVDLEKYKSALLRAKNAIIRPYGAVCRRGGSEYIGETKYTDKRTILVRFTKDADESFLLEFGDRYVRMWQNGKYLGVELVTPFEESVLPDLRFAQSADTMFICSGKHPVQTLVRRSSVSWELRPLELQAAYFEDVNEGKLNEGRWWRVSGNYTFTVTASGQYTVDVAGAGGGAYHWHTGGNGELKTGSLHLSEGQKVSVTVGRSGNYGSTNNNGGASSFGTITAQGGKGASSSKDGDHAGNGQGGRGGYTYEEYQHSYVVAAESGWVRIYDEGENSIQPSRLTGDVVLSSKRSLFTQGMVGSHIRLRHQMRAQSVKLSMHGADVSDGIKVGKQWKITTSGIWTGDIFLEYSEDGVNWNEYRRYSSDKNFNATESGTFDTPTWLRLRKSVTGESMTATLTRLPYIHEGEVRITSITSDVLAKAKVLEPLGNTEYTYRYGLDVWSGQKGYPRVCCFFQDRLVLAGSATYPHMVWMSRTGDYTNFGVEKADGQVTDDSAVALSLISREMYNIRHLVPAQDLLVLTDGNEWIVPGDKPITPKTAQVKTQTMRGASNCKPVYIGNRLVYVQARGATVRDMGYSYESDNYNGIDLTLLAKHLVRGYELLAAAYAQEPDSILYMVRNDGAMVCLTLIREQDVYGWSHWTTNGKYLWVENIPEYGEDSVYVIVKRNDKQYIERFRSRDRVFLDSYKRSQGGTIAAGHLQGQILAAVVDGKRLPDTQETVITLAAENVTGAAGLSYETKIEQPGVEVELSDGTVQARTVRVNEVTLRVTESKGGQIGHTFAYMDELPYPDDTNFTGDILVVMPNTDVGFNTRGRVCISSAEPFGLNILAIIRSISVGGGHVRSYNG